MNNKNPQKDKALTQAFPSSIIMDNPPWPLMPAISNAISFGIILNELAGNISVAYADRISSIIINKSFGQPCTAMSNDPELFNMEKTTVKPTNAVPSAF